MSTNTPETGRPLNHPSRNVSNPQSEFLDTDTKNGTYHETIPRAGNEIVVFNATTLPGVNGVHNKPIPGETLTPWENVRQHVLTIPQEQLADEFYYAVSRRSEEGDMVSQQILRRMIELGDEEIKNPTKLIRMQEKANVIDIGERYTQTL